jgi:hypothetical protein
MTNGNDLYGADEHLIGSHRDRSGCDNDHTDNRALRRAAIHCGAA